MQDATWNGLLEMLTTTVTAFGSWAEFRNAMANGYCPTLRDATERKNASREQRTYNKAVTALRGMVRAEGFKVFDGKQVA